MDTKEKLSLLRQWMQQNQFDAVIIPSGDPHASEYPAPRFEVRKWLTGFTGSTGTAVVTLKRAELWTDSRYFLQAEEQLQGNGFELCRQNGYDPSEYLEKLLDALPENSSIGIDGRLLPAARFDKMQRMFGKKNIRIRTDADPAALWKDRPEFPDEKTYPYPVRYAGESARQKIRSLRDFLIRTSSEGIFITPLDQIAYLLNLRGSDIPYNPVFYAYLYIGRDSGILFCRKSKITEEVSSYLESENISVEDYDSAETFLKDCKGTLCADFNDFSIRHRDLAREARLKNIPSPILAQKAVKNPVEIENIRRAMIRDAVVLTEFYRRVEQEAPKKGMSEYDIVLLLENIYKKRGHALDKSFSTIVGADSNGAIVHYSPKQDTAGTVTENSMVLIDSGAQYLEGTTDITRTLFTGRGPSPRQKRDYTLVLKGHIALARAVFPENTPARALDSLARHFLWSHGLHYGHGTGHGVGMFLNVHEAPVSFSSPEPLKTGSVITDEPGYYRPGHYGIRIENMLTVVEKQTSEGVRFLGFETLTLAPYERKLIDVGMLSKEEIDWIDAYHRLLYDKTGPLLDSEDRLWLREKTRPLEE